MALRWVRVAKGIKEPKEQGVRSVSRTRSQSRSRHRRIIWGGGFAVTPPPPNVFIMKSKKYRFENYKRNEFQVLDLCGLRTGRSSEREKTYTLYRALVGTTRPGAHVTFSVYPYPYFDRLLLFFRPFHFFFFLFLGARISPSSRRRATRARGRRKHL